MTTRVNHYAARFISFAGLISDSSTQKDSIFRNRLIEIEKKRFMDQLLEEAQAAYANDHIRREAMETAEAFLPFENETPDNEESGEKWWK